jgi:hypothetical protein
MPVIGDSGESGKPTDLSNLLKLNFFEQHWAL